MQSAIDNFRANLNRIRELHLVLGAFRGSLTSAVDLSDILRAEVVLAVSSLDHFIHEITRLGMLECWQGRRSKTDAFNRFTFSVGLVTALTTAPDPVPLIDAEIRTRHGYLTFQHPDKIAEAIRLISDVRLWEEVARRLGEQPASVKTSLGLIVDRRNKIAHEADIDPSFPGTRWPIDDQLVVQIVDRLEEVGSQIFEIVAQP